jgi:hypothetical protein
MNKIQKLATGLAAILMLVSVALMSPRSHSQATSGVVAPLPTVSSEVSPELPQDQVRDLTF